MMTLLRRSFEHEEKTYASHQISGTTPISGTAPISATSVVSIERLPLTAIDIRFATFWRGRGGLDIFGLPLTPAIVRPDGIVIQYFERARFELHPELAGTRYEVQLGQLGVLALQAKAKE